jgi:lysozyme
MHNYTKAQCLQILKTQQAQQYGPEVYKCSPEIAHNPFFFGAAIDAAWNAGSGAWCRSPMARLFKAGKNKQACEAFRNWYVTSAGRLSRGLQRRRDYDPMSEYHTCLKGL